MARPASWRQQLLACWPLETSVVTWTFGGDATVLHDYTLTTTRNPRRLTTWAAAFCARLPNVAYDSCVLLCSDVCEDAGCNQLCLPGRQDHFACLCTDNSPIPYVLAPDEKTCHYFNVTGLCLVHNVIVFIRRLAVMLWIVIRPWLGWLVEQGLTSHSTQFRSFRRRCFYRSDDPTNGVKALKEGG